jgi:ATP-dependent protease Clp ATPase subunit
MAVATCSFCERTADQVTHLVQGPKVFICDICVDACIDTLATKARGWRERQIDYVLRLRHRKQPVETEAQAGANTQPSPNSN